MTIIPRTTNEKHRKNKIRKILDAARLTFYRKGYLDVTMQDIIDECGISRGGIYLYFNSVDEIFQEVVRQRNKEKFSAISKAVQDKAPFTEVLDNYMALQKERLINIEESLFRAYCEYVFSKPKGTVLAFRDVQLNHLRKSVLSILMLGVSQGVIRDEKISRLADHFIVVIDGLSVLSLGGALTENVVEAQFDILSEMIKNIEIRSL
ncbi:MAG: TetR/AcrR family transcriptional regulator [Defluviitaleaceae bacterium]|nr:TetR/AcrR family transcriptional regulator [Defluviitaleaceae bacterium]